MHSCPKKTSEAMFDWMATTALKTFFERMTILTKSTFLGVLFVYRNWIRNKQKTTLSSTVKRDGRK